MLGLAGLNVFLLLKLLTSFDVSNFTAIFDYQMVVGYCALVAVVAGVLFVLRNLTRVVTYVSGNVTDTQAFIRVTAVETLIVIICFVTLSFSNLAVYYLFNQIV
jgi:hypothetical protein